MKILITTPGVYALPVSDENPTGEAPIGYEMEVESAPEGWNGKYHILDRGSVSAPDVAAPEQIDLSVPDLVKHIGGITDPDEIEKLIKAETDGKARKGATAALEARRDELLAA